jgi:hypothetical protein
MNKHFEMAVARSSPGHQDNRGSIAKKADEPNKSYQDNRLNVRVAV